MENIPCRFCQQPAKYSPLTGLEELGTKAYWCQVCWAEYLYMENSSYANSYSLYTTIRNNAYRWTVSASQEAYLFGVKNDDSPPVGPAGKLLLSLSSDTILPVITPQNIKEKISIYLLFL